MTLSVSLLGPPLAEVDGQPLSVDTRKATALLAYLAVEPGRHGRESLAALLWPDYAPDRARAALRRTLSTLRSALGGNWLAVARDAVSLERDGLSLDVDEFRRLAAGRRPRRARAGCRRSSAAPFLAGFGLRDSAAIRRLAVAPGRRRSRASSASYSIASPKDSAPAATMPAPSSTRVAGSRSIR